MSPSVFTHRHRVTYSECTVGDHIYYSRYLDLLEEARGEFFRHLGTPFRHWQEQGVIFPVVECRLQYKAPARYDELLAIELWPTSLEKIRLNFGARILKESGQLVLEAETFHVCASLEGKPRRLPDDLVDLLKPLLQK